MDNIAKKDNLNPDWIKIDVQGTEFEILAGASRTLDGASVVIVELSSRLKALKKLGIFNTPVS